MNIRVAAYAQPDLIVPNGDPSDFPPLAPYPKDRSRHGRDVLSTLANLYGRIHLALNAAAPSIAHPVYRRQPQRAPPEAFTTRTAAPLATR